MFLRPLFPCRGAEDKGQLENTSTMSKGKLEDTGAMSKGKLEDTGAMPKANRNECSDTDRAGKARE